MTSGRFMRHLDFDVTPIVELSYFAKQLGIKLFCKRDDLFHEAGGGNKARMLQYILADVRHSNCDVVVTAGGPCSNFNRACALMCAKLDIPMHLVEYTENPNEFSFSLNYYLCNLANIRKTRCQKNDVATTIQQVMNGYKNNKAKLIYGGGKSLEGVFAYYDAVRELAAQISNIDHIFLACGTGTTTTGVVAGAQKYFPKAIVHAISIARTWGQEKDILNDDMRVLNDFLRETYNFSNFHFTDAYLCGGYDRTIPEELNIIKTSVAKEGMIVDPCYSGKAFYGMVQEIRNSLDDYKGQSVLFWNTGGLFNLLSMREMYGF